MSKAKTRRSANAPSNQLRIIGGQWRGRKLSFPSVDGLRPTTDRVRETVFNWLSADIHGAQCLDLFAGSGALGLEALSRGASLVDLVDNAQSATRQLRDNLQLLDANHGHVSQANAADWLQQNAGNRYDVIFLDPPFRQDLAQRCIQLIDQQAMLKPDGWLYLEMGKDEALPELPPQWLLHREKTAGQVCYRLYKLPRQV
ncbi:16S rRNA (guanine(966)-N(2))-methyltransferase RsmD [Oceanicoccus sagamiensis]|uniref:Ribosomal RNA small subunit methyltransferase D n=1 Tax=Oceanicoccus sagamiensis TaxID=716816 RepID=A0A1X9N7Y6_9GAMM|nr:16S rRNA (guanine(966)-N(2))-methyltransferase RsmD [Oceanicoccus sagamiensis]ARN74180.1 16S rRNA (guanine(966)-N(2))-methyltransferase RsmD [Oceanicoccus sagamiensis]